MDCPKCNKELEIYRADVNLERDGLRVWITCSDNCCPFSKILELGIGDIIGIGKDPEAEKESRAAIAGAVERVKKNKER